MAHSLTVVQINDVHAYMEPHQELFWERGKEVFRQAGGYARMASFLKRIRGEAAEVLVADNGDTLHGTYPAVQSRGEALVPVLNRLGLHAMTGHWDFAYGPEVLRERVSQLSYPLLAANVYEKSGGSPAFPSHTVVELGRSRVGVAGLASNIVDKTMPPHFSEGLRFTLGREELPEVIQRLRAGEGVDLVVVLSHLGFPQDMKLAAEVKGIDLLLSGHTHNRLTRPVIEGDTLVIQSGAHGSFIGRLDLEFDGRRITNYRHRLIEVDASIPEDPEVSDLVEAAVAPHRDLLSEVVGETVTALHRYGMLESTMDNLLLEALLEASGAELAFSNGWRYGAPIVPGPVTMNDLYNIIPSNPPVMMADLNGEEILQMLEENLERTFAADPYQQMGGYLKRAAGMRAYVKVENPAGQRIQKLFVGGEEMVPGRTYSASFVTVQGVPGRYGQNRQELPLRAVDALKQYVTRHSPVRPELRGSFVLV